MSVKNIWTSKDTKIISLFFFFELLIIAVIFILTFVTDVRKAVLNRNVSTRQDAIKRGYGYYSDPEVGDCFTETGNCETPGTRFIFQRCIPNFSNGDGYGVGCVDDDGIFTYDMIITEDGCNQQCYEDTISLQDNIQTANNQGKLVVTSVGTHQLLDKETGLDMSDYFIGDFDLSKMTYKVRNCIIDIKQYDGYKQKLYTCEAGTQGGVDGCIYTCGSDPTITFNTSVSKNTQQFLGNIPFPFYISGGTTSDDGTVTGGTKVFVCKDIQDNNAVEMFNHGQTIPSSFQFPEKCYNHINLNQPPDANGGTLIIQSSNIYTTDDRYIYINQDTSTFAPYFQPDYNYLNDLRTYVKIVSNQEIMLLSRMYDGIGGLTGVQSDESIVGYLAVPTSVVTQEEVESSTSISFTGDTIVPDVEIIPRLGSDTSVISEGGFYFLPFNMLGDPSSKALFSGTVPLTGTYIYDEPTDSLSIFLPQFGTATELYIYMKFNDSEYWIPRIFKVTTDSGSFATIGYNSIPFSKPSTVSGLIKFRFFLAESEFTAKLDQAHNNFQTDLSNIIVTGCMMVERFNLTDGNDQILTLKFTEPSQDTFYIKGTPKTVNSSAVTGKLGFYYPLSLTKVDSDKTYQTYTFIEYPGVTFYLPTDGTVGSSVMSGSYSSYDFVTGVGTVLVPTITTKLTYGKTTYDAVTYTSPSILMKGIDYSPGPYQLDDSQNYIFVTSVDNNDNTLLEVVRNGDTLFEGFETDLIIDGQLRKTIQQESLSYQITIFPEKILQIERDFGNFLGPYTVDQDGKRSFICVDSTGTPVPNGTVRRFNIGETVTALIQDYNFNTETPSECGTILLQNQTGCRQERDSSTYNISQNCISSNPGGDYSAVEGFLEDGYLLDDDNKLGCFSGGSSVPETQCTQPYLTDYLDISRKYAPGEELILNNGDIKAYVSLEDDNTDLPSADTWATYSELQEINFNVGQYLGEQQIYITTEPGNIFMNMDYNIKPLELLKYRTNDDYTSTINIFNNSNLNYNQFRDKNNLVTPFLIAKSSNNDEISFTMNNTDNTNPLISVVLKTAVDQTQDKIFLQENYLNRLLWYMTSVNFLKLTTSQLDSFANINFAKLTDNNNTVPNLNTSTTITLHNSQPKDNLTGYYCYYMPMFVSDNFATNGSFQALFAYQWGAYIYGLLNSDSDNLPCKFEVVYVNGYNGSDISLIRNVTDIPDDQLLKLYGDGIPPNPGHIDGIYTLLLPFSKEGPFRRLHTLNSDKKSFDLQFSMTSNYDILTQHLEAGTLPVDGTGKTYSFFNYGYSGFTIEDGYQSPSFSTGDVKLVQYNMTGNRTGCQVYIKHIRVTGNNVIYFSEVGDGNLVHRTGDVIRFAGFQFNILGKNVSLLSSDKSRYELFDYQVEPVSGNFVENYNDDVYFDSYVKYISPDNSNPYIDYLLPSIYRESNGNLHYVLNISYDSLTTTPPINIYIIPSDIGTPTSPGTEKTLQGTSQISFLQDPTGSALQSNDNAGQYIRMVNSGNGMVVTTISVINIQGQSSISVDNVVGKPYGRLSFPDQINSNYSTIIAGKTFISKFVASNTSLGISTRYEIDGYNFGIENVDLASVDMLLKTYTTNTDYYRNFQSRANYGDLILFTDFRSKLTYRNNTDAPTLFDPAKIDSQIWADNGKVNPQVNYKQYNDLEIYSKGDIVKYNGIIWKAQNNINLAPPGGTPRKVPSPDNTDWLQQNPKGELYSKLNYFNTIVTPLDDNPDVLQQELTVTSVGDVHIFPSPVDQLVNYNTPTFTPSDSSAKGGARYLFNVRYKFNMTGTPKLYLKSGSDLMDGKYNFTQNQYIMEINYFLDNEEVTRDRYLTTSSTDKVDVSILIRRAEKSLLTSTLISQSNTIQFGSDNTASDGELLFVNNNEEIVYQIEQLNQLDNQNIPLRISDGQSLGWCFEECSKNISDSYTDPEFDFIDLISSGLKASFFNNIMRVFQSSDHFVSLSNEPCDVLSTPGDRYLARCSDNDGSGIPYSQYLFSIPSLTRDQYGVPFCGNSGPDGVDSLLYSNSIFFYFTPMDIDSQNFLKATPPTSSTLRFQKYFKPNIFLSGTYTLTADQVIVKASDGTYSQPTNPVALDFNSNMTIIANDPFWFPVSILNLQPVNITNGSNTILFTPISFSVAFIFTTAPDDDPDAYAAINLYSPWWLRDSDGNNVAHGFFFWPGSKPSGISTGNMIPLSYTDDVQRYASQPSLFVVIKGTDGKDLTKNAPVQGVLIQDYTLTPSGTITSPSQKVIYSGGGISVSIYFDANNNIYGPGDIEYSTTTAFQSTDTVYLKVFGDQCICKAYLNYGRYNALMSYRTDGTTVPDINGNPTVPLIFNRSKQSVLSIEQQEITLVDGESLTATPNFASTFIIENGNLKPNPIQKPFNLNETSGYYPDILNLDLSVIGSRSSNTLTATKLSDFSITNTGDAIDYLNGINGETQNTYLTNSELIDFAYRQNMYRQNYQQAEYRCNFVLLENDTIPTQATYVLKQNGNNQTVTTDTSGNEVGSITIRTNNYVILDQSLIDAPIKLLVDGKEITSQNISYPNDQFLVVKYTLGEFTVDMETYLDEETFLASKTRLIELVYETEYEGTTTPGVTKVTTEDGFTINIIENS